MEPITQKLNWWLFSWRVLDDIRLTRNASIYNSKCFNDFQQVLIFSLCHMILFWGIRTGCLFWNTFEVYPPQLFDLNTLIFASNLFSTILWRSSKINGGSLIYIYSWICMRIWMHWIDITLLYISYWICMFVDVHWSKFSWWIHRKFQLWYSVQMRPPTRLSCVRVCQLK